MSLLSFTVVTGYLRGEHNCPYEIHATGCRDLRKLQRTQPNYEVLAVTGDHAVTIAIDDLQGTAARPDFWIQPCCLLKRMQAIDRAPAGYDPAAELAALRATPVAEPVNIILTDAEPVAIAASDAPLVTLT